VIFNVRIEIGRLAGTWVVVVAAVAVVAVVAVAVAAVVAVVAAVAVAAAVVVVLLVPLLLVHAAVLCRWFLAQLNSLQGFFLDYLNCIL
jgi:hypothetical protein